MSTEIKLWVIFFQRYIGEKEREEIASDRWLPLLCSSKVHLGFLRKVIISSRSSNDPRILVHSRSRMVIKRQQEIN